MTTYYAKGGKNISLTTEDLRDALAETFNKVGLPERALLLPPDATRLFSRAGELTVLSHELLGDRVTDIMPALGTHSPCLLYTSPSPRDLSTSRMPSSA